MLTRLIYRIENRTIGGITLNSSQLKATIAEHIMMHYKSLYRLAFSYVQTEEDAMDVVQESACKALEAYQKIQSQSYIKTWLYRIVINTSIDTLRKRKKETIGIEDYMLDQTLTDPNNAYTDLELMDLFHLLNEKDRTVMILRFFEDMKLDDISAITMESVNTVKTRLYRALKLLKIQYEEQE